jgi:hypothetical protein
LFFSQLMRKSYSKTQTTETSQQREKKRRIQTETTTTTRVFLSRVRLPCARIYDNVCEVV